MAVSAAPRARPPKFKWAQLQGGPGTGTAVGGGKVRRASGGGWIFEGVSKEVEVGFESAGKEKGKGPPVPRPRAGDNGLKGRAYAQD